MTSLLARSQGRFLFQHPWLLLLSLLGVAIGVAGVVGMDLAIVSCRRGFELSQERLTGKATHWVVPISSQGFAESLYVRLRCDLGVRHCAPLVEGSVRLSTGQSFHLVGVEPLAYLDFQESWPTGAGDLALASPGAVAMTEAEARRLGIAQGANLGGQLVVKTLLRGLKPEAEEALAGQLLCDLSVAQEELGLVGRLSRIEVILTDQEASALEKELPTDVRLIPASTRSEATGQMSKAFFLNLQALSLLSLLVGGLLIYNVIHFLALQRRTWIGQLRLLGVSGREILWLILEEAAWLGTWGSWLGLWLGVSLSRLMLPLLTRTINDLYYSLHVSQAYLSFGSLAKGCLLGWGCALAAAWFPARELAATPPIQALQRSRLESHSMTWGGRLTVLAVVVLALSWVLLVVAESSLGLNLVAMFGLILGSAGLAPASLVVAQRKMRGLLPSLRARLVLGAVERSISRLGVALVAMTVALSAVVSITVMVHSFRLSLLDWLQHTLRCDLYVGQSDRQGAKAGQPLDPALRDQLRRDPSVREVIGLKMRPVYFRLRGQLGLTQLVGEEVKLERFRFVRSAPQEGPPGAGQVWASEPFLQHWKIEPGQELELPTQQGWQKFQVVAAFQDYSSDSGYLEMGLPAYRQAFQDDTLSGLGVLCDQPEELRRRILTWPQAAGLEVRSQYALKKLSVEIFEQTFLVTRLLQILAVLVAGAGVAGAITANQWERRKEAALLESLGLTRRERVWMGRAEASVYGIWSGLLAIPCGLMQAYAMVCFLNRRAFGWSLEFHVEPLVLLLTPVLGWLAAMLASALSPARKTLLEDLREE